MYGPPIMCLARPRCASHPMTIRDFQAVIGRRPCKQILSRGRTALPDCLIAPASGAVATPWDCFTPFVPDKKVRWSGLEAGGAWWSGKHARRFAGGRQACSGEIDDLLLRDERSGQSYPFRVVCRVGLCGGGTGSIVITRPTGRNTHRRRTMRPGRFRLACAGRDVPALNRAHAIAEVVKCAPRYEKKPDHRGESAEW